MVKNQQEYKEPLVRVTLAVVPGNGYGCHFCDYRLAKGFLYAYVRLLNQQEHFMNQEVQTKKPWYKKWWAITLFIIVGLGIIGSIGKEKKPKEMGPAVNNQENQIVKDTSEKGYKEIFTFSGNGAKKSEPFTITGSRFKIKYDCKGDPNMTLCQAFVYKVGSKLPQGVMNVPGPTKDETVIYGTGEYYIDVNVLGSFSMSVEDYK